MCKEKLPPAWFSSAYLIRNTVLLFVFNLIMFMYLTDFLPYCSRCNIQIIFHCSFQSKLINRHYTPKTEIGQKSYPTYFSKNMKSSWRLWTTYIFGPKRRSSFSRRENGNDMQNWKGWKGSDVTELNNNVYVTFIMLLPCIHIFQQIIILI